jgi:hypothetical protein
LGPATPYGEISVDELDPDRRRALELLLLHHFSTATVLTFAGYASGVYSEVRAWVVDQIHAALEHDFLLHSIFAVAALHLVLEPSTQSGPNHSFDFARIHRIYLNMAIREQRVALSDINETNAAPLTWASFMFSYIALRLLPEDTGEDEWVLPVQFLSMYASIAAVYRATLRYLQGSTFLDYIQATAGPDFRDDNAIFDFSYADPFRQLLRFDDGIEVMDEETHKCYDKTLAYVSKAYEAIAIAREPAHSIYRRLLALGAMVPRQFVALVGQRRPRALAILAHHFAMFKRVDDNCWFRDLADRDVNGIQSIIPDQWQWAMVWPVQTLIQFDALRRSIGSANGSGG